jgi:hypothetical protein
MPNRNDSIKAKLTLVGLPLFGAFIGAVVGGSLLHALAGLASGFVGAVVIVVLDRSDPKQ